MKTIILTAFLFISQLLIAQQVQTLVSGPSGFNDGLAQDSLGNIYASYYFGTVVTKITPSGQTSTHVTGLTNPNGLIFTPDGLLLIPEATANKITLVDTGGNKSLFTSITNPSGLLYLPSGDLLVAQYTQDKVSIIDTAGNISDYWTGSELSGGPVGIAYDTVNKELFVGTFDDAKILKRDSLGVVTQLADLPGWCGFICEAGDYIYATAYSVHKIYRIAKDGSSAKVIAGTGVRGQINGALSQARFDNPNGIIASSNGDTLYISDYTSRSLRVLSGVDSIVLVSGIENEMSEADISIWPNPAKEFINVFVRGTEKLQFDILNLNGSIVNRNSLVINKKNDDTYIISLPSEMTLGHYLLKVSGKTKTEVIPFIKE
jgi:sugar lactone lactonase YvrE